MSEPLTNPRHERFCEEYLEDLNATAAYQRAYPGAKPAAARASAAQLLANPSVADRIAELQAERAARVQVRLDDILRELMLIAFSDVRFFTVDDHGNLELRAGAPDHAWRAVSSVKHRIITRGSDDDEFTVREIEYRLWNKPDALKLLKAHLGDGRDQSDDVIPLGALRKAIQRAALRAG
ncbi:MAG TPA: terminase small subunit [Gemmatimonadales bacterium]|nr:terminase small subunit [Gemmatimonadales bacterium]